MNQFGGNAFGSGLPPPFLGPFPQQGFGQFGNAGGFYNGGVPFQGGNMFPAGGVAFPPRSFSPGPIGGVPFPPRSFSPGPIGGVPFPPRSFSPGPMGDIPFPPRSFSPGPMGGQFGSGFGMPLVPGNGFINQQIPFPSGQPQPGFGDPNYFGSGAYDRPRSRHSSRHRFKSRRHRNSSSSSSDGERHGRGSPFAGPEIQYQNLQPFQNAPPFLPRAISPGIPPRRPVW